MVGTQTLYEEVVKVAEDYLGPAAPRIMGRLVNNHLQKEPTSLRRQDVKELTKWTRLAVSVVTEDKTVINEFMARLKQLGEQRAR